MVFCALSFLYAAPSIVFADTDIESKISKLESAVTTAQSSGDNAWMLVSTALVLMMTGPGLVLFYGNYSAANRHKIR
jgi:Amt family ammonium transporter